MFSIVLALALCTQFSAEPPIVGDHVVLVGMGTAFYEPVLGYSLPTLCASNKPDVHVPPGQVAKVFSKFQEPRLLQGLRTPFGSTDPEISYTTYFMLQLPNNKTISVDGYWVHKIDDLGLVKKIFAELSASNAESAKTARKVADRKVASRINAKRRQALAKKYRLDLQMLDLIEAMGRANGW